MDAETREISPAMRDRELKPAGCRANAVDLGKGHYPEILKFFREKPEGGRIQEIAEILETHPDNLRATMYNLCNSEVITAQREEGKSITYSLTDFGRKVVEKGLTLIPKKPSPDKPLMVRLKRRLKIT